MPTANTTSPSRTKTRAKRRKSTSARRKTAAARKSTSTATRTAAATRLPVSERPVAAFGDYAERAVLIPVGATLIARDRVVTGVTDTLSIYSSSTKAQAQLSGVRVIEPLVEPDGRSLDRIAAMVAEGSLRVALQSVLALEQAEEAHRRLEAGGVRGKLVLGVRRPRRSRRR